MSDIGPDPGQHDAGPPDPGDGEYDWANPIAIVVLAILTIVVIFAVLTLGYAWVEPYLGGTP